MDNEQPHQELVKCVVVGDTAVGKTRLICARACNKQVSLGQLLSTHVPTVWAIDQYRIYKDVLERSWEVVDSVSVSLRLWDTFGDHEKDRRFAYGRSDVVLLCFSVNNPISLRNCRLMWYPEIRSFCPNTPVLLVGCKNDLRHMYRDEAYLTYFRDRSPFVRATRKSDLVMPDEARDVARELGLSYYETSVLTYYGVNEVFENAIRAALMARRQQRFWMTNLKRVQRPLLQAPFKPPPPPQPEVQVGPSTFATDARRLWLDRSHTDVIIICGQVGFAAHRFILAAASPAFYRLLTTADMLGRSNSDSSMVSSLGEYADDTECLVRAEQKVCRRRASCHDAAASIAAVAAAMPLPLLPHPPASVVVPVTIEPRGASSDGSGAGGDACAVVDGATVGVISAAGVGVAVGVGVISSGAGGAEVEVHICTHKPLPLAPANHQLHLLGEQPRRTTICAATGAVLGGGGGGGMTGSGGATTHMLLVTGASAADQHGAAFQSVRQVDGQTVITMSGAISPSAVQMCLQFAYTGTIDAGRGIELQDLRRAAELLELPHLIPYLANIAAGGNNNNNGTAAGGPGGGLVVVTASGSNNNNNGRHHHRHHSMHMHYAPSEMYEAHLRRRLQDVCLDQGLFADVIFELDDGGCAAHKPMLAARCDMMRAMFSGDYRESQAKVVEFPGVREYTFHKLLYFLYTDDIPAVQASRCVNLLELANRLCLPRLVSLVEQRVIEDLERLPSSAEAIEHCLRLLEPVKLHNAHQLADFCMNHLCVNYNKLCRMSPRSLRLLHPENQAYLVEHRWPPVWYLKDYDYYQKCLVERNRETKPTLKSSSGCLCFTRKSESDPALSSSSTDKL